MSMAGGPDVDWLQFRSVAGRPLGHGNPPINDEQVGLGYANRHLPNRDRRQGDVTTLKFACTHGPCFLTGIVPPIIERPLPSQPQRIAQGCFQAAQARHGAGQFFKMSRSMRSRSFSWRNRAISEAWSADIGVVCVLARHAADVGSCRTFSTQRASRRPSSLPNDVIERPLDSTSSTAWRLYSSIKRPALTFHSTPPGSLSQLQVSTPSEEVHSTRGSGDFGHGHGEESLKRRKNGLD
jgi:hypothetical protein